MERGGIREGAGRPKGRTGRTHDAPHRARASLSPQHPVHVVLRTKSRWAQLRRSTIYTALRRVLQRYYGRDDFRVVHLSIQHTHLHLLVEAADRRALTRGMQSFAINAARAIHAVDGSRGKVFAFRYHATQIKTARYARHALAYVLNNWRRHREDQRNLRALHATFDPYASGLTFRGWRGSPRFALPARYTPLPVSPPRTALLRSDWRAFGLIDPLEVPGPIVARGSRFARPRALPPETAASRF